MVGFAVLTLVGFFTFGFTLIGGVAGGLAGIALGRSAGKRIRKKSK